MRQISPRHVKVKQSKVNIDLLSKQTSNALERSLVNGITQCYLPPDRGESPDFTPWHSPVLILPSHGKWKAEST